MNKIYNTKTRKSEDLPEEEVQSAIIQGTHSFPASAWINVVDSSGKVSSVSAVDLPDVLNQGYSLESSKQGIIREYVQENKGLAGAAKVAISKFADEAALGIPGIIYEKTGDPLEVAKYEALKKEHGVAKALGSVAGFGASLLVGGPLFKGATAAGEVASKAVASQLSAAGLQRGSQSVAKDIVARLGTKATQLGVEGAIVSAPRAITEAALGDPEQAGETLLYGASIGAALGVGATALEPAVSKVMDAFRKAAKSGESAVRNFQNERAADALGFSKSQRNKLRGGSEEAKDISETVLNATLSDGEKVFTPLSSTSDLARNVERLKDEAGQRIGSVYQKFDDQGVKVFNPLEVASKVDQELGTFWRSPLNKGETAQLENTIESIVMRGDKPISFLEAQALKEELGQAAYPKGYGGGPITPKMELARSANKIVTQEIDRAVNEAAARVGDTALLTELKDARNLYYASKNASRALEDKLKGEGGNRFFSLTDQIAGIGVTAGVGALPAAAAVGAKKIAEKYGNQFLATAPIEGLLAIEQAMKKVALKLDEIPQAIESLHAGASKSVRPDFVGALTRLAEGTKSRVEAFNAVSKKITDPNSNPSQMADDIAKVATPFEQGGAPGIAGQFNMKMAKAMQYLDSQLPRPLSPPNPFFKEEFKPSDAQISAFERKLNTVLDPFSVIDDLKSGSLTSDQVQTLKVVYPKIYEQIQKRIINYVAEKPKNVPYQARLKLSLLMGAPFDASLSPQSIQAYQGTYAVEEQQQAQMQSNNPKAKLDAANRLNPTTKVNNRT